MRSIAKMKKLLGAAYQSETAKKCPDIPARNLKELCECRSNATKYKSSAQNGNI